LIEAEKRDGKLGDDQEGGLNNATPTETTQDAQLKKGQRGRKAGRGFYKGESSNPENFSCGGREDPGVEPRRKQRGYSENVKDKLEAKGRTICRLT